MKGKLLNLGLILSSLIGYLEWGTDNSMFLFEAELDILVKLFTDPLSVLHPFTLIPLIGQLVLAYTLFQKEPSKILTYIGMAGIALLLFLMFAIGLMSLNYKIILSTTPFIVVSILTIWHLRTAANSSD